MLKIIKKSYYVNFLESNNLVFKCMFLLINKKILYVIFNILQIP